MLHDHMRCQILIFHSAREEGPKFRSMSKLVDLANVDDESELSRSITY